MRKQEQEDFPTLKLTSPKFQTILHVCDRCVMFTIFFIFFFSNIIANLLPMIDDKFFLIKIGPKRTTQFGLTAQQRARNNILYKLNFFPIHMRRNIENKKK